MPFVELPNSPHAPGVCPVRIHYRDVGSGPPVIFLHGGWGYRVYPINRQIKVFRDRIRFIIPDRSGYGRSTPLSGPTPIDFHRRAAEETILFLETLGIRRAIFWGHSDGAVIAARIGLMAPRRCVRLILEAFHFEPRKPNSRRFFKQFAANPGDVKEKTEKLLAADHGEDRWKKVVQKSCRGWLKLTSESEQSKDDLFDGQLSKLKVPLTFMHGRCDPRTEPGEIERAHKAVGHAAMRFIELGRHSPHSERGSWKECNEILAGVFRR